MSNKFFDYVSDGGKRIIFGLPSTEELNGREAILPDGGKVCFGDEMAIKCDDDLFLADMAGRILLIEEGEDLSLKALDAEKAAGGANTIPEELEGWETDVCLASGYMLTATFADGSLKLTPASKPQIPPMFLEVGIVSPTVEPDADAEPETFALETVKVGDKRFLFRVPETGEVLFFDARRFLFYALTEGRAVTGFAEIPPKEQGGDSGSPKASA